jgi:hypothetical protein
MRRNLEQIQVCDLIAPKYSANSDCISEITKLRFDLELDLPLEDLIEV